MEDITGPLFRIPEEHNIALKFKDHHLLDDHANLLKRFKAELKLPNSPLFPEDHCSKKLLQLMTREDKVICDLIDTIKTGQPMSIHGTYVKNFSKDLHVKDDLLFLDNKLVLPATIRGTFSAMLHETHPGQFRIMFLAEYIWWPRIYRKIYHHGKSCDKCLKAGKNLKVLLGTDHTTKLPTLTFANEEINLVYAGPLDPFCGTKINFSYFDRFTKFPSAKIVKKYFFKHGYLIFKRLLSPSQFPKEDKSQPRVIILITRFWKFLWKIQHRNHLLYSRRL